MDTIECIMTRRSIRKFMDVDVERTKLGIVLEAGAHAPSAGNIQNWKFFLVSREDLKKKIGEACMQQSWIATAPIIIVVASEPEKATQYYGVRGERLYSVQNCAAVAQNMLLAAHDQGLASCWIGAFNEESINKTLNMGHRFRPQIVLPLGYADESVPEPLRLRIENLVIFEDQRGGGNGGGSRIKDLDWAVWDFNPVGRAIQNGKDASTKLSKSGKRFFEMLKERMKKKKDENKDGEKSPQDKK